MSNIVAMPLVARSFSTRIRNFARELEPISSCTSYVLGYVKSELAPAPSTKTA